MPKTKIRKKGVVLFITLATILIVVILANVILRVISSHSRLTHHQVSRIQAYYASLAAINYAYDKIRTGDAAWAVSSNSTNTRTLCRTCSSPDINEQNLPTSVQDVVITISGKDVAGCDPPGNEGMCVKAKATFTSIP